MLKHLFRNPEGAFIATSDGGPNALIKGLVPFAVPGTLVGGRSAKGFSWARFDLNPSLPVDSLTLKVIYLGTSYDVKVGAIQVLDFHVLVDEDVEVLKVTQGAVLHAFGIASDGNMIGFPAYYKRLGEVPNCVRCPFWSNGDQGKECALFRWQPAGLHHLNQPACKTEERSRAGIKLLKVFDGYDDKPVSMLAQAVWRQIQTVRNTSGPKNAKVSTESAEQRRSRISAKAQLSVYAMEIDEKLADVGCEYPLFDIPDAVLQDVLAHCDGLTEAAKVINLLEGDLTQGTDALRKAIEDAREQLMDIESIEWLVEHSLI